MQLSATINSCEWQTSSLNQLRHLCLHRIHRKFMPYVVEEKIQGEHKKMTIKYPSLYWEVVKQGKMWNEYPVITLIVKILEKSRLIPSTLLTLYPSSLTFYHSHITTLIILPQSSFDHEFFCILTQTNRSLKCSNGELTFVHIYRFLTFLFGLNHRSQMV